MFSRSKSYQTGLTQHLILRIAFSLLTVFRIWSSQWMKVFPSIFFGVINFMSAGFPSSLSPLSSPHHRAQGLQALLHHCMIDRKAWLESMDVNRSRRHTLPWGKDSQRVRQALSRSFLPEIGASCKSWKAQPSAPFLCQPLPLADSAMWGWGSSELQ